MMTIIFTALVTKIINTPVTALDANIAQGTTDPKAALTNSNYNVIITYFQRCQSKTTKQ